MAKSCDLKTSKCKPCIGVRLFLPILLIYTIIQMFGVSKAPEKRTVTDFKTKETIVYSKKELKEKLTDIEFNVTQENGTERPFTSDLNKNKEPGIYVDKVSGEPLYLSTHKYDSGTGWPSFFDSPFKKNLIEKSDNTLLSSRTEIRSKGGDSHLGHVFSDGPQDKTGLRYCMNGAALKFIHIDNMEEEGYGKFVNLLEDEAFAGAERPITVTGDHR